MWAAISDLLFPARCLGCGRQLGASRLPLFCGPCREQVIYTSSPCCSCCGVPFPSGSDHLCGDCLQNRFAFDLARSALIYKSPVRELILDLKFRQQLSVLASLAALTRDARLLDHFTEPDLILPVPLHPTRLRQRGFNQALLLANHCFPELRSKIAADLLIRTRPTRPQTCLSGAKRRRNLVDAFAVKKARIVVRRRILLVDDVFTTGTTVHACASILRQAGAARIETFTVARVV